MRNVLLNGFTSVEEIERAVLEQNSDLPEAKLDEIRRQLGDFKSYFNEIEASQSMIANMVEERPGFEFGNYNFRIRRSVLEADDEPRLTEFEESPSLIDSLSDFGELLDKERSSLTASN